MGEYYLNQAVKAIEEKRVFLGVQTAHAICDPTNVLYAECLSRLRDERGNQIAAMQFVPALEKAGRIFSLDFIVLSKVLEFLDSHESAVLGCNISTFTMNSRASWDMILYQLKKREHVLSRLVLEITETISINDLALFNTFLNDARKLGCRVALDDFGSGLLQPVHLYSIKVDIIKIDAGILHGSRDKKYSESLRHFIRFTECFVSTIVIEGVETEEDYWRLNEFKDVYLQGRFMSDVVPINTYKA